MPNLRSIFATAIPAAPAPEKAAVESLKFLPVTFNAFIRPARTIIAVPCWSS